MIFDSSLRMRRRARGVHLRGSRHCLAGMISSRRAAERAEEYAYQFSGSYNFFYFHDGNKNVSDLVSYQSARGVPAHYEYAPFGTVTSATTNAAFTAFNVTEVNPFRFSSEYADDRLGLVCYNHRHYNAQKGRWLSKDFGHLGRRDNLYLAMRNAPITQFDFIGLSTIGDILDKVKDCYEKFIPTGWNINDSKVKQIPGTNE